MKRLALVVALLALLGGCYRYRGTLPGTIRPDNPASYEVVGDFEVEIERRWALFGWMKVGHEDLESAVRQAVADQGGDGAIHVVVRTESDPADMFFATLNFFVPCGWYSRHMVVTGQAVKFKETDADAP